MFKQKFGVDKLHIPDEKGNYRETIRINDDAVNKLNWNPTDKLLTYINSL